jgi:hypothetical protein
MPTANARDRKTNAPLNLTNNSEMELEFFADLLLFVPDRVNKKASQKDYFGGFNFQAWTMLEKGFFFYPDFTVDSGISPDHASARGLYHRSGIEKHCFSHPAPKNY